MSDYKPGTDWQAKHQAAGQNTGQHPNWTIADGTSVTQRETHNHPMTDTQLSDMIGGDQ